MARVIEVTYTKAAEKRPYPEQIAFKIVLTDEDDIQLVVKRARITAQIAFGERPAGARAEMQRERMLSQAQRLADEAQALTTRGF